MGGMPVFAGVNWVVLIQSPQATLREEGFDNDAALDSAIKKLEMDVRKARKKEDEDGQEEAPTFPLLDVPDDDVSSYIGTLE